MNIGNDEHVKVFLASNIIIFLLLNNFNTAVYDISNIFFPLIMIKIRIIYIVVNETVLLK